MTQQTKRENFTQLPNILFDGCSDLDSLEKWLCACLSRLCWIPGKKYQISLRLIEKVSGISPGYLCPCKGKTPREGMLLKLQRLGYIIVEKGERKNSPYIIQTTDRLWEENTSKSVYPVNTVDDRTVYPVSTDVYPVSTDVYPVSTDVYPVNAEGVLKSSQKLVEEPPNTSNTSNINKTTAHTREDVSSRQKPSLYTKTVHSTESKKRLERYHPGVTPQPLLPETIDRQFKMPDRLAAKPDEEEPHPLSRKERERSEEQQRKVIWTLIEKTLHIPFPQRVRESPRNRNGINDLIADGFTLEQIERGLQNLSDWKKVNTLTIDDFHLHLPGLLAAKEPSKPAAHSSRPLDIAPQPGGWGRRLDGAMMPGAGRVRHD